MSKEQPATRRAGNERDERRRRTVVVAAAVLVVLAAVAGIAVSVQSAPDTTGQEVPEPRGTLNGYSLPLGNVEAPVRVTVYEDFLCRSCARFDAGSRGMLRAYAATGEVSVRYHVVSAPDRSSGGEYTTRAANALAVVLDTAGTEVAVVFHDLLHDNQPAEGAPGPSDQRLIDLAVRAGADRQEVTEPIRSRRFEQWAVSSTEAWSSAGFERTPTVTVNGEPVRYRSVDELVRATRSAVDAALAK